MSKLLGMFARYWQPGEVKTRLAASQGPEWAAVVHRAFVETLIARFGGTADDRVVAFTPGRAEDEFREVVGHRWRLMPQVDGDLGCRMGAFFEQSLARCERVVLIGSDSPDLPTAHIEAAFAALDSHDVVLGPASDGGYYLVGAARQIPPIFAGIAWGTDCVWGQTIERLRSARCNWYQLPQWFDVDDQGGLDSLCSRLSQESDSDPHLARLNNRLQGLLSDRAAM